MSGHNKLLKTMLSSLVLILLAVAIMVSPSLVGQVVATAEVGINSDSVYIPDPNLEAAIRDELNKSAGDITVTDMESLLYLYASYRDIKMLTGLEYAVNLEGLYLDYNQLTDISALSGLVNLRSLYLDYNPVSYTHLDVYKRQAMKRSASATAFHPAAWQRLATF